MIRSISSLTESAADSPNADQQDYIKLAGQKTRTESADQDLRSFTRDIHGKLRGSLWSLNSRPPLSGSLLITSPPEQADQLYEQEMRPFLAVEKEFPVRRVSS
ncbi:hypothetical protein FBUS_01215 [Fasciolopsis buskii]|uniref:Uncharacterized protein n=1 Tax=Fasciolopsis buskii TaxID=27845 RepID=A0A8E0RTM1_9TREM|nr:hypothetical protein FBUS_01215 [Fasciolopsis buski]